MKKILLALLTIAVIAATGWVPARAAPASCFSDEIADIGTHWGGGDIAALARMGVVSGYPEKDQEGENRYYFRPDRKVTRAEFAVILAGALGLEGIPGAGAFADSPGIPSWAAGSVAALHHLGIVKGFPLPGGGVEFRPGSPVTRAELAAMFSGAAGSGAGPGEAPGFADVPAGSWYSGAVARAYALGIIRGRSPWVFAPLDGASRAEVAAMTVRLLEKDASGIPPDGLLAGVVERYYKALPAAIADGDPSGLLALADGEFYLGLSRGGAGIWEGIPDSGSTLKVNPGAPEVIFKSGRLARLKCISEFTDSPGDPGDGGLSGSLAESIFLRRVGQEWKIYQVKVEEIRL